MAFPWPSIGAGALVSLAVISIYRGWLWTKPAVDKLCNRYDKELENKDKELEFWRQAFQAADKRNDKLADYVQELMEVARTSNAALSSLPPIKDHS